MDKQKIAVGIIGTGRIGTDLMMKILKSDILECSLFVGRSKTSEGIKVAKSLGVPTSDRSIQAFVERSEEFEVVFDATSADHHRIHAPMFEELGLLAIDLTPAKLGYSCVPSINLDSARYAKNVNMITCGGQASVPIAEVLTKVFPDISRMEIHTLVAEDSIGPGYLREY